IVDSCFKRGLVSFHGRKRNVLLSALILCLWKYTFAHIRYSVPEESKSGTIIGNIVKDLGLEIKQLNGRGFRVISGSKQQLLQVNINTGDLFVNEIIDREMLCGRDQKCFTSIKIIMENPLEIHQAEIEILDINDNSPAFQNKKKILEISELTQIGSRFLVEGAFDPDSGVNSLKLYQLSKNDYFGLEVKEDSKTNKIPVLVLLKALDREVSGKFDFLLKAIDGGNPPKSGDMNITVIVSDVNDNAPIFAEEVYSVTLEENAPLGTLVLKVKATDSDEGSNSEIVYSFEESVNNIISKLFVLDSFTGEITVNGVIDFEETKLYEIEVKATDRGQIPLSSHCTVLIKILDMNDNAPLIEITSLTSSVSEDVKRGTVVGLISITDLDSGVNSKITCTSSENLPFELKKSLQKNLYSLITTSPLDRESTSYYNITITAKDFGQPSLTTYETVTVNVLDVNDNHPRFLQDPYVFYLEENNTPGASFCAISAVDEDANENAVISYYLRENEAVDKPLLPFLSINSFNGEVFSFVTFDFEEVKSFTFIVVAKDSGVPSLSSNVTVKVFILDQNDNSPVVVFPLTANQTAIGEETIPRNVKAGHVITRIRAYDADVGYNAWLSFSLDEVSDRSLFSVGRYTGDIRTLRAIMESDMTVHKMVILVKDSGSVSFSTSVTIIVTAAETTEAHALSEINTRTIDEDKENKLTFYLIVVLSSVSSLFLVAVISLFACQCWKTHNDLISNKYLGDSNYAEVTGSLFHDQYQVAEKQFVFLGPEMNRDSAMGRENNGNTLIISDSGIQIGRTVSQTFKTNTFFFPFCCIRVVDFPTICTVAKKVKRKVFFS
uniref:Cadherin domain-containing protein n=1 Tax=Erpetoichthys calabaricus TaxID=27687 RepID=A0A8C4SHL1_ERPCA